MKSFIKDLLINAAREDYIWSVLKPLSTFGVFLKNARALYESKHVNPKYKQLLFDSLRVQNGPFKGMKYPQIDAVGSCKYPKLLGTYEKELWPVIERFKSRKYSDIVDVGCAEGYYAVGLGLSLKEAKVHAYDINEDGRKLCIQMSRLNNIEDRILIKAECTPEDLENFYFGGRGLIICDCEGYEKVLFNHKNLKNLTNCDLLIETHDSMDIEISSYIKNLFGDTHHVTSLKSIDDIEKAHTYMVDGLEQLNLYERKEVVSEIRHSTVEWVICEAK
ncbi:class I SAM-dependent methyltransferase [Reichenbachiella versicolor]|uniref:hypothetical protein n=1 Tax=Reichenbachiella versicolor TaxID=1821036 RepID=UPI000D6EAA8D|nr:hypothetical protein [Reichenbachiella versicolor]